MRVLHHTSFDFPLDRHFLGESIIIGSLVRDDQNETYVLSSSANSVATPGLAGYLASAQFATTLTQGTYRGEDTETYFRFIRKLLEDTEQPVILHYHFPRGDLDVTRRVKAEFGDDVRTVMQLHCMPELFQPDRYNHSTDKRGIDEMLETANVDKYIAVSNAVKTAFVYAGLIDGPAISTINNGVDTNIYSPMSSKERDALRREIGIKGERIVGYVGRMNENKGVKTLLQLLKFFERTQEERYGFIFATSNGSERRSFLRKVHEVAPKLIERDQVKVVLDVAKLTGAGGMADQAVYDHFLRQLQAEGITTTRAYGGVLTRPVQGALDYYVHPAFSEAIGLSILEALSMGVPVLASETGGIPEVVSDSNGVLVRIEKPEQSVVNIGEEERVHSRNANRLVRAMHEIEDRISERKIARPEAMHGSIKNRMHTTDSMREKTNQVYKRLVEGESY